MKRKILVAGSILSILAVSFLVMSYLSSGKKEEAGSFNLTAKKRVQAIPVVYTDTIVFIDGKGRVSPRNDFNLSAEVPGKILYGSVSLKKGERFRKGDLLFRIHADEAQLALKARKSRFMTTVASLLPDIKVDFPTEFSKWSAFFDGIQVDKPLPLIPAIADKQEKIFLAGRNIIPEYYGIQSDEIRLEKHSIHAPFDGSFSDVYAEVGSIANPGQNLAKISRTDKLEIELPIPLEESRYIKIGTRAEISSEWDSKVTISGKVVRKSDFVDPATQSVLLYVEMDYDSDHPVYQGQYLSVRIEGNTLLDVMELPRRALVNGREVYLIVDGRLVKERVELEKIYPKTFLFTGLPEGVFVVTEALVNPVEGTEVEIL